VIGLAQATTLTPIVNNQGNMSWQNIGGASYTFADTNHNGQLNVNETVTFVIDMQKSNWGTHDFDALKVWIDHTAVSLDASKSEWHYDPSNENQKWFAQPGDTYSWRPWTQQDGGDKLISFDYKFTTAGTFDFTASVMCSRDLSSLNSLGGMDQPVQADWNAWTENTHRDSLILLQGETEKYQLTVVQTPVPEPETYAMMMAGLGLMGFMVRRRKTKQE
jgi:hypothetical protein